MGARLLAVMVAVSLVLSPGLVGAAGARPPDAAHGAQAAATGDESPAAQARRTGRRVEVMAQRSETRVVYANPDGSFTAELHTMPVRVRRGDGWVPVDTTLRARPDGTVGRVATVTPLALSRGGTAPLVRIGDAEAQVEIGWPGALPAPTLRGPTATYPGVLPGVDLRITAVAEGVTEALVVKTREAGRDPALTRLRLNLATRGLTLRAGADGRLAATDGAGEVVFQSGPAQMWDAPAPGPREAASGAHSAASRVALTGRQLTVVPDQRLLDDPATVYPVSIEVAPLAVRNAWAKVFSGKPTTSYWNGGGDVELDGRNLAKVGQCYQGSPDACNGIGAARSFFRFDTGYLAGAHILEAEFNAFEVWSPSCTARPVDLWRTGAVSASTTWNNQPGGWVKLSSRNVAFGHDSGCAPDWVGFGATAGVSAGGTTTLALRAANENDQLGWKKFTSDGRLVVTYNFPPRVPIGLTANDKACAAQPNEPYLDDPSPTLRATVSDPDGGLVRAQFQYWVRFGSMLGEVTTAAQSSGTRFAFTIPDGKFADGSKIAWRVRGFDGIDHTGPTAGWSDFCDVTIDSVPPATAPTVSSTTYPENDLGGAIGRTGAFTFTANGVADVVGFVYDLHDQPQRFVAANAPGGSATALVTPPDDGPMDLFVRSQDRAGNWGPMTVYHFVVGPGTRPVAHWRLDGWHTATAAPDGSGSGHHGTVTGIAPATGAAWTSGRVDHALRFDTGGYVSTTGGQAVNTAGTFTVTAWVRLDRADDAFHAAVSQDGNRVFGLYLGYMGDSSRFAFRMVPGDSETIPTVRATAATAPAVGVWTHLTGVFDQATRQMRLYVNGVLAGTATQTAPWNATGAVQIGRAKYAGAYTEYWPGAVDDVRIYSRVLSVQEIHDLATTPSVEELFLPFDDGGGTTAGDASGNWRNATLSGGASWASGRVGDGALQLDGTGGAAGAAGPAVRTDSSFTVSALARLDAAGTSAQTIVSQDGPQSSGFALQYLPPSGSAAGRWAFLLSPSDAASPAYIAAESPEPAQPEEWTHLTGVYDQAAGEARLYVNGALVARKPGAAAANVAGAPQVGRAKRGGAATAHLAGTVDDVHAFTGVRTDDQILADFLEPVTRRLTVYTGQFSRWVTHTGDHATSATGVAPVGYRFEAPLGLPAPDGAPGTRMLWSCQRNGTDEFTTADSAECQGTGLRLLGQLGNVYAERPADVATLPLYRCAVQSRDRFLSHDPNCEGQTVETLLGYVRAYAYLIRYVQYDLGDHWTTIRRPTADYRPEGNFGVVPLTAEAGATILRTCVDAADVFSSTDAACEGATQLETAGRIWTAPPAGVAVSQELYRCRRSNGERFDSPDPGCEGRTFDRSLGYVVTQL